MPFLVLLPLIESNGGMEDATPTTLLHMLGPTALNSAAGLGMLLLSGRFVLRRIYEVGGVWVPRGGYTRLVLLVRLPAPNPHWAAPPDRTGLPTPLHSAASAAGRAQSYPIPSHPNPSYP